MALYFNGSPGDPNGDHLKITSGFPNDNVAYTCMMWVKIDAQTPRINVIWYAKNGVYGAEYLSTAATDTKLVFTSIIHHGSVGYSVTSPTALTPDTWYHVAVVRPSTTGAPQIYINGALAFTGLAQNVGVRSPIDAFYIGTGADVGGSPLRGAVAHGRWWGWAMTPEQIQAEMYSTVPVVPVAMYADWRFSGGVGQRHLDWSGKGHHWTEVGTITDLANPPFVQGMTLPRIGTTRQIYAPVVARQGAEALFPSALPSALTLFPPAIGRSPLRIDIGADAQDAVYEYRGVQATSVEIGYYPKQAYTGKLWGTKDGDPSSVKAFDTREILVSPESAEGFKITPTHFDYFGVGSSQYTATYTIPAENEEDEDTLVDVTSSVIAHIYQEGQQLRITWENGTEHDVKITAEIHGVGVMTKDKQTLLVESPDLLLENRFRHVPAKAEFKLVSDENEAQSVAQHLLDITENQRDGLFQIRYDFGNSLLDTDRVRRLLSIKVGDVIQLTEDQSMLENAPHIVLSESFSYGAGKLSMTQTLIPVELEEIPYLKLIYPPRLSRLGVLYAPTIEVAEFDLLSISGLHIWYDFDDLSTVFASGSTLVTTDGDTVSWVADKSGNNRNASQNNGSYEPLSKFAIQNGKNVLRFNGSNARINLPNLSALTAGEAFMVFKLDEFPPSTARSLWYMGTAPQQAEIATNGYVKESFGTSTNRWSPTAFSGDMGEWGVYNAASSDGYGQNWWNGDSIMNTTSNTVSFPTAPMIGKAATALYLDGDVGEFILFSRVLTTEERDQVRAYLEAKWGIT